MTFLRVTSAHVSHTAATIVPPGEAIRHALDENFDALVAAAKEDQAKYREMLTTWPDEARVYNPVQLRNALADVLTPVVQQLGRIALLIDFDTRPEHANRHYFMGAQAWRRNALEGVTLRLAQQIVTEKGLDLRTFATELVAVLGHELIHIEQMRRQNTPQGGVSSDDETSYLESPQEANAKAWNIVQDVLRDMRPKDLMAGDFPRQLNGNVWARYLSEDITDATRKRVMRRVFDMLTVLQTRAKEHHAHWSKWWADRNYEATDEEQAMAEEAFWRDYWAKLLAGSKQAVRVTAADVLKTAAMLDVPPKMLAEATKIVTDAVNYFARKFLTQQLVAEKKYNEALPTYIKQLEGEIAGLSDVLEKIDASPSVVETIYVPPLGQATSSKYVRVWRNRIGTYFMDLGEEAYQAPDKGKPFSSRMELEAYVSSFLQKRLKILEDNFADIDDMSELRAEEEAALATLPNGKPRGWAEISSDAHGIREYVAVDIPIDLAGWRYEDLVDTEKLPATISVAVYPWSATGGENGHWQSSKQFPGIVLFVGSMFSAPQIALKNNLTTLHHEMAHAAQSFIEWGKDLKAPGGLPSGTGNVDPDDKNIPHPQREIEFYPNLISELGAFEKNLSYKPATVTPEQRLELAKAWVNTSERFRAVRSLDEVRWRKMVTEFMRAVQQPKQALLRVTAAHLALSLRRIGHQRYEGTCGAHRIQIGGADEVQHGSYPVGRRQRRVKQWHVKVDGQPAGTAASFGEAKALAVAACSGGTKTAAGTLPFLEQCDRLRLRYANGEAFWQEMMRNAQPVSAATFVAAVDVSGLLDEDETFDEYLTGHTDAGFFESSVEGKVVFLLQVAGFEFIFGAPDVKSLWGTKKTAAAAAVAYKVMELSDDGRFLISGANKRIPPIPAQPGQIVRMPGNGIYLSPNKDYVLKYYSGLAENEALVTFEYEPSTITWGNVIDREAEIAVSEATIVSVQPLSATERAAIVRVTAADLTKQSAENPRHALTEAISALKTAVFEGEAVPTSELRMVVAIVRQLDQELTGKIDNRKAETDLQHLEKLVSFETGSWVIYLSDGGYSRIVIDFDRSSIVSIDVGLSLPKVVENWKKLADDTSNRIIAWIDSLGDPITVWRAVGVNAIDDVNLEQPGVFWTAVKEKADSPFRDGKNRQAVIEAQIKRADVDDAATIATMRRYPDEMEIRLRQDASAKIVAVEFEEKRKSLSTARAVTITAADLARTAAGEVVERAIDEIAGSDFALRQQLEQAARQLAAEDYEDDEIVDALWQRRQRHVVERSVKPTRPAEPQTPGTAISPEEAHRGFPGAEFAGESANYWTFHITSYAGAKRLGTTNWCIVRDEHIWADYTQKNGVDFYFHVSKQHGPPAQYAVAVLADEDGNKHSETYGPQDEIVIEDIVGVHDFHKERGTSNTPAVLVQQLDALAAKEPRAFTNLAENPFATNGGLSQMLDQNKVPPEKIKGAVDAIATLKWGNTSSSEKQMIWEMLVNRVPHGELVDAIFDSSSTAEGESVTDAAAEWAANGFEDGYQIKNWARIGIHNPELARRLPKESGASWNQIALWLGKLSFEELAQLRAEPIEEWVRQAREYADAEYARYRPKAVRVTAADVVFNSVSDNPERWVYKTNKFEPGVETKQVGDFTLHRSAPNPYGDEIVAIDKTGDVVGSLFFMVEEPTQGPGNLRGAVEVRPDTRRKGLATALYSWAEELTGKKFVPDAPHTPYAEAFWKQKNRPFGKDGFLAITAADLASRTAKPRWREEGVELPDFASAVEQYVDQPGVFFHMTDLEKLGINPKQDFNTPLGIYAYPLNRMLFNQIVSNRLPFRGDAQNIIVFEADMSKVPDFGDSDYTEAQYRAALQKLQPAMQDRMRKLFLAFFDKMRASGIGYEAFEDFRQAEAIAQQTSWSENDLERLDLHITPLFKDVDASIGTDVDEAALKLDIDNTKLWQQWRALLLGHSVALDPDGLKQNIARAESEAHVKTPLGKLWNVTRVLSGDMRSWAVLLRQLGFEGFADIKACLGGIHTAEPCQAVFFSSAPLTVIGSYKNPNGGEQAKDKKKDKLQRALSKMIAAENWATFERVFEQYLKVDPGLTYISHYDVIAFARTAPEGLVVRVYNQLGDAAWSAKQEILAVLGGKNKDLAVYLRTSTPKMQSLLAQLDQLIQQALALGATWQYAGSLNLGGISDAGYWLDPRTKLGLLESPNKQFGYEPRFDDKDLTYSIADLKRKIDIVRKEQAGTPMSENDKGWGLIPYLEPRGGEPEPVDLPSTATAKTAARVTFVDELATRGELPIGAVRPGDRVRFRVTDEDGTIEAGTIGEVTAAGTDSLHVDAPVTFEATDGSITTGVATVSVEPAVVEILIDSRDPRLSQNRVRLSPTT